MQEVVVPVYVEEERTAPPKLSPFVRIPDEQLLGFGVPEEWLDDVRNATEDSVLDLADHLPAEGPRRCWSWPWAGLHSRLFLCQWAATHSATLMPCVASAS